MTDVCYVGAFETQVGIHIPVVQFHAGVRCNATPIKLFFTITERADVIFELSMWQRYCASGICYSFIHRRNTGVSALTETFHSGAWLLIMSTTVVLARLMSWLSMDSYSGIFTEIWMRSVTVIDVDIINRRYSQNVAALQALILRSFLGRIDSNYTMY